jgi:hypothetical protein
MATHVGLQGSSRVPLKPFKELAKRHRDFIKAYVRSGDAEASYAKVGYKPSKVQAQVLLRKLQPYIGPALSEYVKGTELGIIGLSMVEQLARYSLNDMVRLNAAKELLSRALPEDAKEVHHIHQKAELTDEQLMGRIEELRNKLLGSPLAGANTPVVDINTRKAIK